MKIGADDRGDLVSVIGAVPLDLGCRLLAGSTARKAGAAIRHFAIDASAPSINAATFALDALAGFRVGL